MGESLTGRLHYISLSVERPCTQYPSIHRCAYIHYIHYSHTYTVDKTLTNAHTHTVTKRSS